MMKLFLIYLYFSSFAEANTSNILEAAHRLMDVFYQNCHAHQKIYFKELEGFSFEYNDKTNGKVSIIKNQRLAQKNDYLRCSKDNYICTHPPSYLWGGKGKVTHSNQTIFDVTQNTNEVELMAKHPGLDCSGFVNLVFIKARLLVDHRLPFWELPYEISAKDFMQSLSCFEEKKGEIKKGNVIAWAKHVVIVDHIGSNPFGIKQIKTPEDCNLTKLNPLKASMIVINSKGSSDPLGLLNENDLVKHNKYLQKYLKEISSQMTGTGIGISRLPLKYLTATYPNEIMELIQQKCLEKFNIYLPSRKIKMVRHKNEQADCHILEDEKISFIGDELKCN